MSTVAFAPSGLPSSTSSFLHNENLLANDARRRENVGDEGNDDGLYFSRRPVIRLPVFDLFSSFNRKVAEDVLHDEDDDEEEDTDDVFVIAFACQSGSPDLTGGGAAAFADDVVFRSHLVTATASSEDGLNLYALEELFLISDGLTTGSIRMEERWLGRHAAGKRSAEDGSAVCGN